MLGDAGKLLVVVVQNTCTHSHIAAQCVFPKSTLITRESLAFQLVTVHNVNERTAR